MHNCHCITPLHAFLLLHCITSLHHSSLAAPLQHCSAAPPCSTPLHCLTNSSAPFHSTTAPLRDLVASSLLFTTALHHSTAPLPLCITSLHHSTIASPLHYITAPLHHYSTAPYCTTPRHCRTPARHSNTSRHHYEIS
jgi:hypothetical protein